jgi:hypothetical protein
MSGHRDRSEVTEPWQRAVANPNHIGLHRAGDWWSDEARRITDRMRAEKVVDAAIERAGSAQEWLALSGLLADIILSAGRAA